MPELVHYAVADAVATITLDSPHNRNALSKQLVTELFGHLERPAADDEVRVVLIALGQGLLLGRRPLRGHGRRDGGGRQADRRAPAPDRVDGQAGRGGAYGAVRAGGIGIVAAADIAVAPTSRHVRADRGEARPGRRDHQPDRPPPDDPRAAALTTLGGEVFGGADAAAYGLVTMAVPDDEIDARSPRCAAWRPARPRVCASRSGSSTPTWSRASTRGVPRWRPSARLFASDEAREAMTAFLSRKK